MALRDPYLFAYQDESGGIKSGPYFIVGFLLVRHREPILEAIQKARKAENYWNELHFKKTGERRHRAFRRVFDEVAKVRSQFRFLTLVVPNNLVNLRYFGGKKHAAYNYFTRLLLERKCVFLTSTMVYVDQKSRLEKDRFIYLLRDKINFKLGREAICRVIETDSKTDDLIQLTDLLTGCINNLYGGHEKCGELKTQTREHTERLKLYYRNRDCIWEWKLRSD